MMYSVCIVLSCVYKISTILKIRSSEGIHKAFSTCASHLTIVLMYYGSSIFTYVWPISTYSLEKDRLISVLYSIVTPTLSPLIYTLRNKDIKGSLKWILTRKLYSKWRHKHVYQLFLKKKCTHFQCIIYVSC